MHKSNHEVLSFEAFKREKNNFHLHFKDDFVGNIYRKGEAYKKCVNEKQNEIMVLVEELKYLDDPESLNYVIILYYAYKIMRTYAKNDLELFQ